MKNTLKLKRIIFLYLDSNYREIYLLELDHLGDIVQTFDEKKQDCWTDIRKVGKSKNSWFDMRGEVVDTLVLLFSINHTTADSILNDWVNCRPKYKYVRKWVDVQGIDPIVFVAENIGGKEEWILVPVTRETHMTM